MNTLTCKDCGHRPYYHYHDDDLLDETCHDESGHHACAHFRCRYPWQPSAEPAEPACRCPNFVPMDSGGDHVTDPLAELEAADAVLLLALCIPNADGTEDAEIMADQIAEMVNEERERNGAPQKPAERVEVHLWPAPQFVTAEQIQWLLDALRDHRAGGRWRETRS